MSVGTTPDCLVIGGGVVGLSVAYQLATDGLSVTVLERGQPGGEASWAGAGILPPASWYDDRPALDRFAWAAHALYPVWSAKLFEATGIDNEYWQCGANYLRSANNEPHLQQVFCRWRALGIDIQETDSHYHVGQESQIRNPRHLSALVEGCRRLGVAVLSDTPAKRFAHTDDQISSVETSNGTFSAGHVCFAAGCWSSSLVGPLRVRLPGRPVRGQMLLLRPNEPISGKIVHQAPHYMVPRRDGLVLVGATVEEVGFDRRTTDEGLRSLVDAACQIEPRLRDARVEASWAGLRPGGGDGLPQIGLLPGLSNGWAATGHFRAGLQLAPPTAELLSALIRGVAPPVDPSPFSPERFAPVSAV